MIQPFARFGIGIGAFACTPMEWRRGAICARGRQIFGPVLLLVLFLGVGCAPDVTHWTSAASPMQNQVQLVHLQHDVAFDVGAPALGGAAADVLAAFVARQGIGPSDRLYLVAPGEGGVQAARLDAVVRALRRDGLAAKPLADAPWAGPVEADRIRLVVHRLIVLGPDCPDWRKPSGADPANAPGANFGCATTRNLGLMVADPADLFAGRDEGVQDGTRAAAAVHRYRSGTVTPLNRVTVAP